MIWPLLKWLNMRISLALRFAYNVDKGYIMGEEEDHNFIDLMVDQTEIAEELKLQVAMGRMTIMKALGMCNVEGR